MAFADKSCKSLFFQLICVVLAVKCSANDILGCGGFVKSHVSLDFSKVEIGLYTKEGNLKEKTECAPTNGYYFLPLYEKGEYILKVHPPAGWSFEPSEVHLNVDGETDKCSTGDDINFSFNGFGITGKVITAGQKQGPSGVAVHLVDDKGAVRKTVTAVGGDFHFTPVIPGKYTLKASHSKWSLDPSQAIVQVKEGNTALPVGVLVVKGYDVSGTVTSFGSPFKGLYVLLYSKEENPKYRIEGCNTALLQGVPGSPICHVVTTENGEYRFGLVPAGEYKLMALKTNPGQVAVTYNVKPDTVDFTVRHDSLFLRNSFEVSSFTVVGSVISGPGKGVSGARVSLEGSPAGNTDAAGKFTLPNLLPSQYTVTFEHEHCKIEEVRIQVTPEGPRGSLTARVTSWRVCGDVTPARTASLIFSDSDNREAKTIPLDGSTGKWCTYLPPGVYTARVEVGDDEHRTGLQYYPVSQKVSVGHGPVDNIKFSQLVATVTGKVECLSRSLCEGMTVTLRHLSAGNQQQATVHDGTYKFSSISAGTIELSVPTARACWTENVRRVTVTEEIVNVPPFVQNGYIVNVHSTHQMELEYKSGKDTGVWQCPAGLSVQCAKSGELHHLQPRSCHLFTPDKATITPSTDTKTVYFEATAHSVVTKVTTPEQVNDLILTIDRDGKPSEKQPLKKYTRDGGSYIYEFNMYMAEGEIAALSPSCSTLVFSPGAGQVAGRAQCQLEALAFRGRPALTLRGRTQPPVSGVTITLSSDELKLTQVTTDEGSYSFGPLDASKSYSIEAQKESYVFSEPDANGNIKAHKLAEIVVKLVDDADGSPLQGALVSVSGGSYRHNAATRADGTLRFAGLQPHQYYVRPHFKEFKFTPHHHLVTVEDGNTHEITLRGVRVAWSVMGRAVSLGGVGLPRVSLIASPTASAPAAACHPEHAATDDNANFRIRGLLPECEYTLQLKETNSPELSGLKIIKAPEVIHVRDRKDATDVVVIVGGGRLLTDVVVRVRASPQHYRHLSLTAALADTPSTPLFTAKLDNAGFTSSNNPGVVHVLPRLPADNNTYLLQLDTTLSKATHTYNEQIYYFNSDGKFKHFTIEFFPKVKTTEQELRHTSFLFLPLLALLGVAYQYRGAILASIPRGRPRQPPRAPSRPTKPTRPEMDDIDQIVNTVNQTKRAAKKKFI